jgi:uncharacterized membrane protein
MADPIYVLLRILHVGSAIFFVGGATMWSAILVPMLAAMAPTLPKGTMPTLGGKVMKVLPAAALTTLVTGLLLFGSLGGFGPAAGTTWGMLISTAFVLLVVLLIVSLAGIKPTFKKLSQTMMAAQGPPPPEAQQLMRKLTKLSHVTLGLAWLIVLLMVLATSHAL